MTGPIRITVTSPDGDPVEAELVTEGLTQSENRTRWQRGNKTQITLSISPELLVRIDTLASEMGQSRAALINLAIFEMIDRRASA